MTPPLPPLCADSPRVVWASNASSSGQEWPAAVQLAYARRPFYAALYAVVWAAFAAFLAAFVVV